MLRVCNLYSLGKSVTDVNDLDVCCPFWQNRVGMPPTILVQKQACCYSSSALVTSLCRKTSSDLSFG